MTMPKQAARLRIYLGEDDRADGRPLYEAIVLKARALGLAGATVLRGPMGYGHSSRLHTAKILRLSEDLPVVVEIVEARPRIDALLAALGETLQSGLVTVEDVEVVRYGPDEDG